MHSTKHIDRLASNAWLNFMKFLSWKDLTTLLKISATFSNFFIEEAAGSLPIPWEDYRITPAAPLDSKIHYHGVRDYFCFGYLKDLISNVSYTLPYEETKAGNKNFFPSELVQNILKTTYCFHAIHEKIKKPAHLDRNRPKTEWQRFLTHVKETNEKDAKSHESELESRLQRLTSSDQEFCNDPSLAETKKSQLRAKLTNETAVVVTFDDCFPASNRSLINVFEINKDSSPGYIAKRLAAEFATLCAHTSIPDLLSLMLVPALHPNYGAEQLIKKIRPISHHYGDNYFVFDDAIKEISIAHYTNNLNILFINNSRLYLRHGNKSAVSLLMQLPDAKLWSLLHGNDTPITPGFNHDYITVLISSNTPLDYLRHLHVTFPMYCKFIQEENSILNNLLKKDTSMVSVEENPFDSPAVADAYSKKELSQFLKKKYVDHRVAVWRWLAESDEKHIQCEYTADALKVTIQVTRHQDACHQAQAALVLYQLGVVDYFKKWSPIIPPDDLNITHITPLNGSIKQEGGLQDHRAMRDTLADHKAALEQDLRRVFCIALVARQNWFHLQKFNRPHPLTGKGAIEESYQAKELYLGRTTEEIFDIDVQCFYDRAIIKILHFQSDPKLPKFYDTYSGLESEHKQMNTWVVTWVEHCFITMFGRYAIKSAQDGTLIYINMSLPGILAYLDKNRIRYHATNVYDAYGRLLVCPGNGYTGAKSTGGKFLDCDIEALAGRDDEFGSTKMDIGKVRESVGRLEHPSTQCYAVRDYFINFCIDSSEFIVPFSGRPLAYDLFRYDSLDEKQMSEWARYCGMSVDAYRSHFGSALALSDKGIGSLWVDIRHWESAFRRDLIHSGLFHVVIKSDYKVITVHDKKYRRVEPGFGRITISGNVQQLLKAKEYLSNHQIQSCLNEEKQQLELAPINPRFALTLLGVICEGRYAVDYFKEHPEFLENPREALKQIQEIHTAFPTESAAFQCLELVKEKHGNEVIKQLLVAELQLNFESETAGELKLTPGELAWALIKKQYSEGSRFIVRNVLDYCPKELLSSHFSKNPDLRNKAFCAAVHENRVDLVKILIEYGADVELRHEGRSLLQFALSKKFTDVAKVIIDHMMQDKDASAKFCTEKDLPQLEADAAQEELKESILHLILLNSDNSRNDGLRDDQIIFLIKKYSPAVNIRDKVDGWTFFHLLCSDFNGHFDPKITLLPLEINPALLEAKDERCGNTPLLLALAINVDDMQPSDWPKYRKDRALLVDALIEQKANVNAKNVIGQTALDLLMENFRFKVDLDVRAHIAKSLIEHKAEIPTALVETFRRDTMLVSLLPESERIAPVETLKQDEVAVPVLPESKPELPASGVASGGLFSAAKLDPSSSSAPIPPYITSMLHVNRPATARILI